MKDKFMNGFIAGVLANIPVAIFDFLATRLNLDKLDFTNYVSILAFGEPKPDLWESIFACIVQFMFAGVMGVIFNYFIKEVTEKYYYIKSFIYGAIVWFVIYAVDIFFKIEDKAKIDFKTSVSHYTLSVIWGIAAAWVLKWLEKKESEREVSDLR
jgi:ABC-type branched-subunit amino acid transport system permease subunit